MVVSVNKINFLMLRGSDHFIMYDGSMEDDEMNGVSLSITDNLNYAQRFSDYEASNHKLVKDGICVVVFIDRDKTNVDPEYLQLSIFD